MTTQRTLKHRIRRYMHATGLSYTDARAAVLRGLWRSDDRPSPAPEVEMRDQSTTPVIGGVRPFFIVGSLHAAVDHYRDKLGFDVEFVGGDFFAIVRRGRTAIHLKEVRDVAALPNWQRHASARHDAMVETPNPDELYGELVARGAIIHSELGDTGDGLRAFEVRDLDGYVLCFGRPSES